MNFNFSILIMKLLLKFWVTSVPIIVHITSYVLARVHQEDYEGGFRLAYFSGDNMLCS